MNKSIKLEADGDFKFQFYIEKAIASGTEERMTIKGVASTTNIDHDSERMSESSLKAMADIINDQSVPLRVEHQKDDNAIVGNVNKAWVDERNQLWIEADLDKSHPGSSMLYSALKSGAKLGLSVGGRVKHAVKEFSESAGKMIKTFYNVVLDEVSVTSRPANYDAWLVSKSIIDKAEDGEQFVESPFYKEFIFENQAFDYMQSFAKSIPDKAWKRVDINKNNKEELMKKDEKEVKKSEETTEEEKEKSSEGKKEDETETAKAMDAEFKNFVTKGIESLTSIVSKLVKTSDEKEKEETTIMEDKTKSESKETDETKEKSESKDETETKEKAESKETETEASTKDYHVDAMKSILKKMEDLSKAMDETKDETKEKSEAKEDETTEKSQGQDLDYFSEAIAKAVDGLKEKFEKGGKRTPGLTEMFVNMIRNDSEIQSVIKEMVNQPGFKKSMQFGIPTMRTKDGKAYRLSASAMGEEVEKSESTKGKSFKEVYNQKFSSSAKSEE